MCNSPSVDYICCKPDQVENRTLCSWQYFVQSSKNVCKPISGAKSFHGDIESPFVDIYDRKTDKERLGVSVCLNSSVLFESVSNCISHIL